MYRTSNATRGIGGKIDGTSSTIRRTGGKMYTPVITIRNESRVGAEAASS
jgi:hypothetical protein